MMDPIVLCFNKIVIIHVYRADSGVPTVRGCRALHLVSFGHYIDKEESLKIESSVKALMGPHMANPLRDEITAGVHQLPHLEFLELLLTDSCPYTLTDNLLKFV
jgi:hypothetical protein